MAKRSGVGRGLRWGVAVLALCALLGVAALLFGGLRPASGTLLDYLVQGLRAALLTPAPPPPPPLPAPLAPAPDAPPAPAADAPLDAGLRSELQSQRRQLAELGAALEHERGRLTQLAAQAERERAELQQWIEQRPTAAPAKPAVLPAAPERSAPPARAGVPGGGSLGERIEAAEQRLHELERALGELQQTLSTRLHALELGRDGGARERLAAQQELQGRLFNLERRQEALEDSSRAEQQRALGRMDNLERRSEAQERRIEALR